MNKINEDLPPFQNTLSAIISKLHGFKYFLLFSNILTKNWYVIYYSNYRNDMYKSHSRFITRVSYNVQYVSSL